MRILKRHRVLQCPACSSEDHEPGPTDGVYFCNGCGCLHGHCSKLAAFVLVKDEFSKYEDSTEKQMPFDLTFYDPKLGRSDRRQSGEGFIGLQTRKQCGVARIFQTG